MEQKVPGGKLARLTIGNNGRVIISGDFFIYPEEGIDAIERTLAGLCGDAGIEAIEAALFKAVRDNGIELIGIDVPVIARLFEGATHVESPGA